MPRVSVLVPTHNGAAWLAEALASVQGDVEIVVADDGSTDETLSIARRFTSRVLERPHDGSWTRGTNLALREARGEMVSFLHQDDLWRPGRLWRLPSPGFSVHDADFIDARGGRVGRSNLPAGPIVEHLAIQNVIQLPTALFPREAMLAAGGLDESLWFTADWDLWARLASEVTYVPERLAAVRVHPGAQTQSRTGDAAEIRRQVSLVQARVLARLGNPPRLVRAAGFNCEVTVALSSAAHGRAAVAPLFRAALRMRPGDWVAFARSSRLLQRALPRWRTRSGPSRKKSI